MKIGDFAIARILVAGFMLCLSLAMAGGAQAQTALKLDPFARDFVIFDSGSARGRDAAQVPLSGDAPAGATIEGRFRQASGETTAWTHIAQADESGIWAGMLGPLSRSAGWVRPEIRIEGAEGNVVSGGQVSAGHVVAIWGQSELHRAVLPAHAALSSVPEVMSPDTLQVTYSQSAADDYGAPENFAHARISDATPVSAHIASLSNMLAEAAPDQRFHLIFQTRAGTGFQQLLSSENRGRAWADDVALHRFANPQGAQPGLAWISWYNSDSGLGAFYGSVLRIALTGRTADGAPFARGTAPIGTQQVFDNVFPDLYGPQMIWAIAGPHRFEMDQFDARIAANRASVDVTFTGDETTLRRALEPLTYLNGNPRWNGDFSHPDTVDDPTNGMTRLMLLMGNSIVRQLGLVTWPLPQFDDSRISADARIIEVWSNAGPVTTTRASRTGQTNVPVAGFEINGDVAQNVTLRDGRVVIRPNDGAQAFATGLRLTFGAGGIGSQDLVRDTRERQIWQDYPIVDVGQSGIEGIPVKAQTPQTVLGLIDPPDTVQSALPAGNLLHPDVAQFVASDRAPGWISNGTGWTFDPSTASATATLTANRGIRAILERDALLRDRGARMLFTFVPETTGSDDEILRVVISATGGGATELYAADVTLTPGQRMNFELGPFPDDRSSMSIVLRRRGSPTGEITIGSLGLFRAR